MNLRGRFACFASARIRGSVRSSYVRPCLWAGVLLLAVGSAFAQPVGDPVPRNAQAEAVFEEGLQAFESEDYAAAYLDFRVVYEQYAVHRKTTAALLMAGKALYRNRDYAGAVELLTAFLRDYPTSGYREAAGRTLGFAQQKHREDELRSNAIHLGIALPLSANDEPLTQDLFNGVRLAVNAYNQTAMRPVRMTFRDTRNTEEGARQAVTALANAGVDVIIGPLYSDEAEAAAGTADREQVVLVPPLATEEAVAQGRRFVFQANPTITMRGAVMARLAVDDLRLRRVGVAAESGNSISERMAEGFQEEALRRGGEVAFFELLSGARDWVQLPDLVGHDALASVDALYLPIHRDNDRDAHRLIEETLRNLAAVASPPRLLGGSKWRDVAFTRQASTFGVVYADDFYVDDARSEVLTFKRTYRELAEGEQPGRLAYVGYDVARYLIRHLTSASRETLADVLREADLYEGLGMRIKFNRDNTNEAMFFIEYADGAARLLR